MEPDDTVPNLIKSINYTQDEIRAGLRPHTHLVRTTGMASIPAQVHALLHDIQTIRLGNVAGISLISYDIREWA